MAADKTSKFDYILGSGLETPGRGIGIFHHPDTVVEQAKQATPIKYMKYWDSIAGMSERQAHDHRLRLVKNFIIEYAMTPAVRNWYNLLPPADKELPLVTSRYYAGTTLMDKYINAFQIRPLKDHYRRELERMRREVISSSENILEVLSARLFRVEHIYRVIEDLDLLTYISAVIVPIPDSSPIKQSFKELVRTSPDWDTFFANALRALRNEAQWQAELTSGTNHPRTEADEKPHVNWKDWRNKDKFKKRKYGDDPHPSKMNSLTDFEEEEDNERVREHEQPSWAQQMLSQMSGMSSAMSSMQSQINSLKEAPKSIPEPDYNTMAQQGGGMSGTQFQLDQALKNALSSLMAQPPPSNVGSGLPAGPTPSPYNNVDDRRGPSKRQKVISTTPKPHQGYDKDEDVNRYRHNPKGNEDWKMWLRVCHKCGCYGAHFGAYCQGQVRPDFDPNADPRKATPIEAYPSNRIEAMHRCKQEYRKYGDRVRWNCRDKNAPPLQELMS